ncbi:FMRFamide receptor-like [Cataglyphis hispanica]|uniref:FMRFamide receptor-like n=1 Tax=Cataglyphis hispanica TaxID=1086592 RepID=UPI00217F7EC1|nr:FMRFamide receptor-like [Cataglyphis hispanica]XP_050452961.1 FMRFamide receptor-like [Cataglyphis hispanica]XP_050452971.1 FMRFamide receptor-like [Cataglyphis hispanica]XP_050452980.1 FMRFamide receptor-like [Cataglyphis hispanica]XP_050452989.1 FMRFamide receptor-like [Cataglyphis hispanica]XP_050452999.1 FMRFamide receptor-like [Cataglyphis hispanica]XP_050453008.1 FMRFamide receptor-like [Cataglyphis hispanica]
MEMSSTTAVASGYYNVDELAQNFSNVSNVGPSECNQEVNINALSDFIVYGIFINLIGLFGIFGNAISMIILSRPQMKSSINYLLIGLARCDTVLIIIAVLIYGLPAISTYTGLLFDYKFIIYPKIIRYLYPLACIAQFVTVYLTLTVTLERYIAVCHPLRARSFCTYGRAQMAVMLIVIFAFIYNIPKFWEITVYNERHWKYNITVYCVFPTELRSNEYYVTLYIHWMYFFVYYMLPFIALVIFNMAIYQRVRKANRDLQQLSRHQRREIGLATMLLCVVVVFLICNILPLVSNAHETFIADPPHWMVQFGNLLVTINSSINFIIYVIFGRKFKRIFLKLFCSSRLFVPGRDSPEFQTYDESIITNTTNIELRNSVRHGHLNRANTISWNNNIHVSNGSTRQSLKSGRPASPGSCVYYPRTPARSPSQMSRVSNSRRNSWNKKENGDSTL